MHSFSNKLVQIKFKQNLVQMSLMIMYNYAAVLTYYSLGVTISFCKFWFENDIYNIG